MKHSQSSHIPSVASSLAHYVMDVRIHKKLITSWASHIFYQKALDCPNYGPAQLAMNQVRDVLLNHGLSDLDPD